MTNFMGFLVCRFVKLSIKWHANNEINLELEKS